MKKFLSLILVVFILLLQGCMAEPQKESEKSFEPKDWTGEKILENRKKVFELIEENPDALAVVPKPAEREPVPMKPIEGVPDYAVEWAYNFFNHRVTYEVSDRLEYNDKIGHVLRFLTAMRRVENEPVDTFEINVAGEPKITTSDSGNYMAIVVSFSCSYKAYDEEEQDYVITDNDRITVHFSILKESDGKWYAENIKVTGGEYYDYAVSCIYKTMGRFPEISQYEIVDYAIYEYTEKLFDFGVIPPV